MTFRQVTFCRSVITPSHGILSAFVFIALSLTTAASLPIPDASVFQQAFQQQQVPRADAVHHDDAESFSALGLEDQLRLQQERLQQMNSQGRVAQAVEIANNVAILQQQIVRRPQKSKGRMSVIEQLAVSRSSENTVANEMDKNKKTNGAGDLPVAPPQEAFVIKVETVRYDAPAAPLPVVVVVEVAVATEADNVIDLQDAEEPQETAQPLPAWRQYEDVAVYAGCVLAMAAVLYVLSVAVSRRQRSVCKTDSTCPDVFQKVWTSVPGRPSLTSLTLRGRLARTSSNHIMSSPGTAADDVPFGECHVGLQNRILSNFEATSIRD